MGPGPMGPGPWTHGPGPGPMCESPSLSSEPKINIALCVDAKAAPEVPWTLELVITIGVLLASGLIHSPEVMFLTLC